MSITVAVVASGGMGAAVGARLASRGGHVITTLAGRSAASVARAQEARMHDATPEELAGAAVFLSIVPPDQALPLAQSLAPALRAAQQKAIYVDLNAVNPDTARAIARVIDETGAVFVDGGIIGPPPQATGSGPTFYLSGPSERASTVLSELGLAVKRLDGGIGVASALKMSYAGITKGLIALAGCMLLAADRNGVGPDLLAELADSQAPLLSRLGRAIPDMFPKAYRWIPEMREIEGFIGTDLPESQLMAGASEFYRRIAADLAGTGTEVAKLAASVGASS